MICSSIQHEVDHSMPSTRSGNWRCKGTLVRPSTMYAVLTRKICIKNNNLNLGCEIEIKFDF